MNKKRNNFKHIIIAIVLMIALGACSPKLTSNLQSNYQALHYNEEVFVLGVNEAMTIDAEKIGTLKVGDNGFSVNCGYQEVIDLAKTEARKSGGNLIKITEHRPPSTMGSSCHRIVADVYRLNDLSAVKEKLNNAAELMVDENADYATVNIYRFGGYGALVSYNLYLGDSVICRVKNKTKESIKTDKLGHNSIWAKTESKAELPVNLKAGHQYYIRCGIGMGIMMGRPVLELVDPITGKAEFESIKSKK